MGAFLTKKIKISRTLIFNKKQSNQSIVYIFFMPNLFAKWLLNYLYYKSTNEKGTNHPNKKERQTY